MSSSPVAIDAGTNIKNAVAVVSKTYANLSKFLAEIDGLAIEEGLIPLTSGYFLRWRSDNDCRAWLITSFIKLFQNRDAAPHTGIDGLRQGAVYGMEASLSEDIGAVIVLSRFTYDLELRLWPRIPSLSDHWPFHWPRWDHDGFVIKNDGTRSLSTPRNEKIKKRYWGLEKVVFKELPLVAVDSREKIKSLILEPMKNLGESNGDM